MSEFERAITWPVPKPTDESVRLVFKDEIPFAEAESPAERLSNLYRGVLKKRNYYNLGSSLHRHLTAQNYYNDPRISGEQVLRGRPQWDPFIHTVGMNRYGHVAEMLLPLVKDQLADVVFGKGDIQSRLDVAAAAVGALTTESQSFSDGNTRIGLAMHDYIQNGVEGITIDRLTENSRNFMPSNSVEELVLEQNVAKLLKHPEEYILSDRGIVPVSDEIYDGLFAAKSFMQTVVGQPKDRLELRERLKEYMVIDDPNIESLAGAVLSQKQYGPAALVATFPEAIPRYLNTEQAKNLIQVNRELMVMRVASIIIGIARKGDFMAVSKHASGPKVEVAEKWWPTASF